MKRMWSRNELRKIIQETYGIDINNLIGKDGHERFDDGDIQLNASAPEGVEKVYGKWSLSGTHLLVVLCINIPNTTNLGNLNLTKITFPKWIFDKIIPLTSSVIEKKTFDAFGSDNTSQSLTVWLQKTSSTIDLNTSSFTASADRKVRISFDLLIDND